MYLSRGDLSLFIPKTYEGEPTMTIKLEESLNKITQRVISIINGGYKEMWISNIEIVNQVRAMIKTSKVCQLVLRVYSQKVLMKD